MGAENNNYHVKLADHRLLVFGGDQGSSSSSDVDNGGGVEEKRRSSSSSSSMSFVDCSRVVNGWNNERQLEDQGMWENSNMENNYSPFMDYGLEEIKQLISSNTCTTNVLF